MMEKKGFLFIGGFSVILSAALFKLIGMAGMMPPQASHEAILVDQAFDGMLNLTVPIFSLVVATLLYCLYRFRAGGDSCSCEAAGHPSLQEGAKFHGSRGGLVETLWITASLVITLGLAAFGAREFRLIRGTDQADLDVQVNAEQFSWEFFYPKYNEYGSALLLPRDQRVRLLLNSKDVVHSFWVPEFRLKQDVVPGKVVKLLFTPTRAGRYQLLCSELCGRDHTVMTAWVDVVEPEEFEAQIRQSW